MAAFMNPLALDTSVCGNFLELCNTNIIFCIKPLFPETVGSKKNQKGEENKVAHTVIPGLGVLRQEDGGLA